MRFLVVNGTGYGLGDTVRGAIDAYREASGSSVGTLELRLKMIGGLIPVVVSSRRAEVILQYLN